MPTEDINRPSIQLLSKHIHQVIKHKPKIKSLYLYSCFVLAFDYKKPELCKEISDIALSIYPRNRSIAITQGFISVFLLDKIKEGIQYFELAAQPKNSPTFVLSFVKKLKENKLQNSDIKKMREIFFEIQEKSQIKIQKNNRGNNIK